MFYLGKYIGEIVRLALVRLHKERLFCGGQDLSRLESKNAFEASDMSAVEEDTVGNGSENCREIGKKFGLEVSGDDEAVLKHLCALLTHRGTMLVALVLASLLRYCCYFIGWKKMFECFSCLCTTTIGAWPSLELLALR